MAQLINGSAWGEWATAGNTKYCYLSGNVSRSGNTVTLSSLSMYMTFKYSSYASGYTMNTTIRTTDGKTTLSNSNPSFSFNGTKSNTVSLNNASITVGTTDTSYTFRIYDDAGSYVSFTVSFSSGAVAPSTPTVSASSTAGDSTKISVTYGTTSFGTPSSGTVRLYGGTASTPTTQLTSKTTTGNSNYTHSNLAANTRYYYRAQASNSSLTSGYSSTVNAITPCATPSGLSKNSETYTAYNKTKAEIKWTRASDGNAATRTGYYRVSTNGGSSYGSWTSIGTIANGTTTGTFTISNLPTASSIKVQFKINNGRDSGTKETSFTSLATHTAPNFSNYTYRDSNATTSTLTGNNQVMIQGQSTPEITISTSNKATGNQGIAISNYSFNFSGRTDTATWSNSSDVVKTLGTPVNSGTQTMSVSAVDALSLSKAVTKNVMVYPWAKPTINASAKRTNNFENETTLSISGTWSPITISGTDKNTITVDYRYKSSSTSVWEEWTNRPITTSSGNFTSTDLILSLDNSQQWDIQIRAIDEFTTTTVSLVLSVGTPIFFIASDGRVSVGGKPTNTLATGETSHLEVSGTVYMKKGGELGSQQIRGTGHGTWIKARDNSTIYNNNTATGSTFAPAVSFKTPNGVWSLGNLESDERPRLVYTTDTDYSANQNRASDTVYLNTEYLSIGQYYKSGFTASSGTINHIFKTWGKVCYICCCINVSASVSANTSTVIATLPSGWRPPAVAHISGWRADNNNQCRTWIRANGELVVKSTAAFSSGEIDITGWFPLSF